MKKTLIFLTIVSLFTACDGNEVTYLNSPSIDNVTSSGSANVEYSSTDGASDVRNFTVEWNTIDEATFVDEDENLSTISEDDIVENSSFTQTIRISFQDETVNIEGEADGVTVTTDGAHVVVNSTKSGVEYVLSGNSSNGQFKLYSEKKSKVTLNGITLANTNGSALNLQSKKRTFIVATQGTSNTFTDASKYVTTEGEDEKATIFAEGELIFSGTGAITVNGNCKHGICSDQYIVIRTGSLISLSTKKDGIHANDGVTINGGITTIKSTDGDGIDCEQSISVHGGLVKIETTGTATKGIKAAANISITGGKQVILTSGNAEYDTDEKDVSSCSCIKCDTTLTITDGEIYLKSTGSGGKGVNAGGTLNIAGGKIYIVTEGSMYTYGTSSTNGNRGPWGNSQNSSSDDTTSSPKGMKVTGDITISAGTIRVRSLGATEGSEGIESKSRIFITGGDIAVYTADDALNAKTHIEISGGIVYAYATDNDGIDSNGTITISGGVIVSSGTREPEEGFDCDQNTFSITGGTLIGTGGNTSTPTTGKCTQNVVIYGLQASSGAMLTILDSDGNQIISYTIPRSYSTMRLLISSANISNGTYTIYSGGTLTGGNEYNGIITGATFDGGSKLTSFTVNSRVTTVGTTSGGFGGGFNW